MNFIYNITQILGMIISQASSTLRAFPLFQGQRGYILEKVYNLSSAYIYWSILT